MLDVGCSWSFEVFLVVLSRIFEDALWIYVCYPRVVDLCGWSGCFGLVFHFRSLEGFIPTMRTLCNLSVESWRPSSIV